MTVLNKIKEYLRDALESKNTVGEILYGLLDLIPSSSLIDLIQKILERSREVGLVEAIKERKGSMQWTRFTIQIAQLVAFLWIVIDRFIPWETITNLF